jgi:putative hydrolase of the HAD superfamily
LLDLLDARCYTSEMTHTKPHPEAFRTAMSALGVTDPSTVVFVGDRPYDDIHGARHFGMRAVLRPNGLVPGFDVEPDATIDSLTELVGLVDGWSV